MSRNVYRRKTRELEDLTLAKSKLGNVLRHSVEKRQQRVLTLKVFIAWIMLIPLIAVTFSTLVEMFFRALTRTSFWQSEQFIFSPWVGWPGAVPTRWGGVPSMLTWWGMS